MTFHMMGNFAEMNAIPFAEISQTRHKCGNHGKYPNTKCEILQHLKYMYQLSCNYFISSDVIFKDSFLIS